MSKKIIDIKIAEKQTEIEKALKIREEVFIKGQSVSPKREIDGLDKTSEHAIVYLNKKPIGTARIRILDSKIKLERIAILEEARGEGLGICLMDFLIKYCKNKKTKEIYMHAQYYLLDFYSKFGFKQRGDIFLDAGIKHVEMFMKTEAS